MAATRTNLVPAAAYTTSGVGLSLSMLTASMLAISVPITAGSGTVALDLWLEGSNDGGATWFELPADLILKSSGAAAGNAVTANARDVVDNKTSTTAENFVAIYKHVPFDLVRPRWILTGTTPSLTFSVGANAK